MNSANMIFVFMNNVRAMFIQINSPDILFVHLGLPTYYMSMDKIEGNLVIGDGVNEQIICQVN